MLSQEATSSRIGIVFHHAGAQLRTLSIRKLYRRGIVRVDAVPDLLDEREALLDVELVQAELLQ
jgi:hypothetical protein